MYRVTFRILETLDEHFYETDMFSYHWSLNGFRTSGRNTAEALSHKCGEDLEVPGNAGTCIGAQHIFGPAVLAANAGLPVGELDLDRSPRVKFGKIDIGCYQLK
jgi:hypothetical protein